MRILLDSCLAANCKQGELEGIEGCFNVIGDTGLQISN
jgi:hypothetical protein